MATGAQAQLGFDALLAKAETDNRDRRLARETAHLPGTLHVGVPFFARLIEAHHAAMKAGDEAETMRLRKEAGHLATKLNAGAPGILAGEDAPGCVLMRETAAEPGTVPLWGQRGDFIVTVLGCQIRIEMEGLFGIGSAFDYWPGFSAHAVDWDQPFISETGYRSFLGLHCDPIPGLGPDGFAATVIDAHIARELGGRLLDIDRRYAERPGRLLP